MITREYHRPKVARPNLPRLMDVESVTREPTLNGTRVRNVLISGYRHFTEIVTLPQFLCFMGCVWLCWLAAVFAIDIMVERPKLRNRTLGVVQTAGHPLGRHGLPVYVQVHNGHSWHRGLDSDVDEYDDDEEEEDEEEDDEAQWSQLAKRDKIVQQLMKRHDKKRRDKDRTNNNVTGDVTRPSETVRSPMMSRTNQPLASKVAVISPSLDAGGGPRFVEFPTNETHGRNRRLTSNVDGFGKRRRTQSEHVIGSQLATTISSSSSSSSTTLAAVERHRNVTESGC